MHLTKDFNITSLEILVIARKSQSFTHFPFMKPFNRTSGVKNSMQINSNIPILFQTPKFSNILHLVVIVGIASILSYFS